MHTLYRATACIACGRQVRKRETEWKADKAKLARAQAEEARAARAQELEDKKNQGAGTRQAKTEWKARGIGQERRRMGKAKESRSSIQAHREESKVIQATLLDGRKEAAKKERANDHEARDAKVCHSE